MASEDTSDELAAGPALDEETPAEDAGIKRFNFPKMHARIHIFDDVEQKGVVKNYTTKHFERLHRPLKKWYLLRTNFKNIAPQVLIRASPELLFAHCGMWPVDFESRALCARICNHPRPDHLNPGVRKTDCEPRERFRSRIRGFI